MKQKHINWLKILVASGSIFIFNSCKVEQRDAFLREAESQILYDDIQYFLFIEDTLTVLKVNNTSIGLCLNDTIVRDLVQIKLNITKLITHFDTLKSKQEKKIYEIAAVDFYHINVNEKTLNIAISDFIEKYGRSECNYIKEVARLLGSLSKRVYKRVGVGTISEQQATLYLLLRIISRVG